MAAWPGSLPTSFLMEGASVMPRAQSIETEMEVGPPKSRRRTSTDVTDFPAQLVLTGTQVATLETFYTTTTNGGADTWTHVHPITGASANFQFSGRPSYTPTRNDATPANRLWLASLSLRIVP